MSKAAEECKKCTNAMAMRGGIVVVRVNTNIAVNLIGKCMNAMTIEVMMVLKVNTTITTNLLGKCKKGKRTATALGSTGRWGRRGVTAQLATRQEQSRALSMSQCYV